jgi:hypothetical protein
MPHIEGTAMEDKSKALKLDPDAVSTYLELAAFFSPPSGAPVYHGFPLVPETMTDGWVYGAITDFEDPKGCEFGDGYVIAPDGRRAGLIWQVGVGEPAEIIAPEPQRWGVYEVWFPKPIRTVEDLVNAFRNVLPYLQAMHERLFGGGGS